MKQKWLKTHTYNTHTQKGRWGRCCIKLMLRISKFFLVFCTITPREFCTSAEHPPADRCSQLHGSQAVWVIGVFFMICIFYLLTSSCCYQPENIALLDDASNFDDFIAPAVVIANKCWWDFRCLILLSLLLLQFQLRTLRLIANGAFCVNFFLPTSQLLFACIRKKFEVLFTLP